MSFAVLYRLSFYLMLALASLALSFDTASENPLTPLYPLAVVGAGVVAFFTVDRRPDLGISRDLANNLGIASVFLGLLEWWYDERFLVLALGHWIIYLELILLFRHKTIEEDWYLFLLGMVQVMIGGFLGQGEWLGLVLVAWALMALWTLALFYLRREAIRNQPGEGVYVSPLPKPDDPYPGLVNPAFLVSAWNVALTTLLIGGLIFLVMPRWYSGPKSQGSQGFTAHLTGFSDEVKLGQIGEILENDSIVMSIEMYDESGRRVGPEPGHEPLWRGVTMQTYENGRWFRQQTFRLDRRMGQAALQANVSKSIRQQIRLEPSDTDVLFGLRPIIRTGDGEVAMNSNDGAIYRRDMRPDTDYEERTARSEAFDYWVVSAADGSSVQPGEAYPSQQKVVNKLLHVPEPLKSRLEEFVAPVLEKLPPEKATLEARARRLESYLRDSGEYSYTLRMEVSDPSLDPIEDFLVNRKQGHCEYFASALTLMLRSAGVPARLVNGFKGGDWNTLGQLVTVRQKHAHSWVEALVAKKDPGNGQPAQPVWITLDPTPALEREQAVAKVGNAPFRMLLLKDYVRYLWVFYIAGFNADRQDRLIYGPIRQLVEHAARGFRMMGQAIRAAIEWLFHFPDGYSFFSVKGFLVSVVVMLLIAAAVRFILWIDRHIGRLFRRSLSGGSDLDSGVATYRRLMQILAGQGLERPAAETPREFALRAGEYLAAHHADSRDIADVPAQVVDAFYSIRFGDMRPNPETQRFLESRLDALEMRLRPEGA